MRVLISLLLLASAFALAPLETCTREKAEGNRYLVRFYPEQAPEWAFEEIDVAQAWASKTIGGGNVTHAWNMPGFRGLAAFLTPEEVMTVRKLPEVLLVEEDCIFRIPAGEVSEKIEDYNGTILGAEPGLPGYGQYRSDQKTSGYSTGIAFNPGSWGSISGCSRLTAYVLDTGALNTHQQFGGRCTLGPSYISGQSTVDGNGHGTHCAGTIAGSLDNTWSAGYCLGKIVAVKVLSNSGSGATTGIVSGINWVISNRPAGAPNLISMSLGGGASTSLDDACHSANNAGVIPVVAAGNDNANAQNTSPCRSTGSLCVGATDSNNNFASYTNYGNVVDVAAPGTSIKSAWYTSNTAYNTISGTSMATPAMAGMIGLYLVKNGLNSISVSQARQQVVNYGTKNTILNYGNPKTMNPSVGNVIGYDRWA
jgi:subtilisin family serine protease